MHWYFSEFIVFPAIIMFSNNFTVDVTHLGILTLPIGCQHNSFNGLRVEASNSLILVSCFLSHDFVILLILIMMT